MNLVESADLTVTVVSVPPMDNNVYILRERASGRCLVIDCANDASQILETIRAADGSLPLERIVTTHRHPDHIQALAEVVERTGAPAASGIDDARAIQDATGIPQEALADGAEVRLGAIRLRVVQLVGHTPGSIALIVEPAGHPPVVFSGDSLFPGGVGKTTTPEDFASLIEDVERKIFAILPDETLVLPGHGRATTLGAERSKLPAWRERGW
ncbi:MAG: MBL fold metallo-hydrolase [Bowdeniella nasicola]|nr:MBL fold metallo-hydrolase [Bowdeniella nasicola]